MAKAKASPRLYALIGLSGLYMIVEITVGYLVNSLALITDSFHMLSDVLALIVALWARRYAKKDKSDTMTYGWRRAEVVGALANGVFLLALCLNIIIEAIQRFFNVEEISQPKWVLIVGGIGLGVNLIGLFMFHEHGHSHSHGGHSHGHGHSHKKDQRESKAQLVMEPTDPNSPSIDTLEAQEPPPVLKKARTEDMNMRGVFLHVLGDALGSLAVMVSSLIIWLTSFPQRFYIDPIISLLITALILKSTIPLVLRASKILLQAVPDYVDVKLIQKDLEGVTDVVNIHEIHIWQLSNDLLVASLHITCLRSCNFMNLAITLKAVLHRHGIHATTIQPEFIDETEMAEATDGCILRCESKCEEQSCCTKRKTSKAPLIELPREPSSKEISSK